jgi:hypothetical protein
MDEELKPKEESAPSTENKEPSHAELKRQRLYYLEQRRKEVEVLKIDVDFLELQIKHYEASKRIKEINDEVQEKIRIKNLSKELAI